MFSSSFFQRGQQIHIFCEVNFTWFDILVRSLLNCLQFAEYHILLSVFKTFQLTALKLQLFEVVPGCTVTSLETLLELHGANPEPYTGSVMSKA